MPEHPFMEVTTEDMIVIRVGEDTIKVTRAEAKALVAGILHTLERR